MWVVLLVSIHLLVGPSVSVVSDYGPYRSREACEAELKQVRETLTPEDQEAVNRGELAVLCVAVGDYRSLTGTTAEP